jgi:hypothetical protein
MSSRIKFHLHTIECPRGMTAPHAVMWAQLNWLPLKDSLTGSNSSARCDRQNYRIAVLTNRDGQAFQRFPWPAMSRFRARSKNIARSRPRPADDR